jgi:YfiH family protein
MGGASHPPFHSLNLGFHVGDNQQTVIKNRRRLACALGIPSSCFTFAKQIHKGGVKIITEKLRGAGSVEQGKTIDGADALVSNVPNICLVVLIADCVPVLFYDPVKNVAGVAHAGWRGTLRQIVKNTIGVFQEGFGSLSRDIIVGIGPSIGPCCYEVGQEVIAQVEEAFPSKEIYIDRVTKEGKGFFDLWEANKAQLIGAGIPERNIEVAKICTHCSHDSFFSHRFQKGRTGRFGAGIMIQGG